MGIEAAGSPHRLAGIVDDEVEAIEVVAEVRREPLDARSMTEIEAEDLEAVAEARKVGLRRVAPGCIVRKARRNDRVRARTEQEDDGLVADFDASTRDECDAAAKVRGLVALRVVQR